MNRDYRISTIKSQKNLRFARFLVNVSPSVKYHSGMQALSEMYSKKCAEIASREEDIKNLQGQLIVVEEKNEVLDEQNKKLSLKLEVCCSTSSVSDCTINSEDKLRCSF